MKKHWYDYLWIVELTYLILGFFNILFAWIGLFFFFIPLIIAIARGDKGLLQPLLRSGTGIQPAGRPVWPLPEKGHPKMDEKQSVPLRFPDLVFHHVFPDALEYILGLCRDPRSPAGSHTAVDLQGSLELGLSWHPVPSRRGSIRFWILQRDADLHGAGTGHHGAVQTP